jgi:hypothetical protein
MPDDQYFVDLGKVCGDVCKKLYQKLKGKHLDELNQFVLDAIEDLTA